MIPPTMQFYIKHNKVLPCPWLIYIKGNEVPGWAFDTYQEAKQCMSDLRAYWGKQ